MTNLDLITRPAEEQLTRMINALEPLPGVTVDLQMVTGEPARELDTIARAIHADVTVIATHRRGLVERLILGSVAGTLLRLASTPLLIVGEDRRARGPLKNVIAAIDLTPAARAVLAHAEALTDPRGELRVLSSSELELILARLPGDAFRGTNVSELTEVLEGRYYAKVKLLVERCVTPGLSINIDVRALGLAREVILESARDVGCDLLVIGTSGHHAWQRLMLGSTAGWVAAHAPCPVLVCPIDRTIDRYEDPVPR
jgi:nucleotide-binding universal stress UspA family protein